MDFSDPITAAFIGAAATVLTALVQLRYSWRRELKDRERGQPITKKTRRGPVIAVFVLLIAAAAGGFFLSQYVMSLLDEDRDSPQSWADSRVQAGQDAGQAKFVENAFERPDGAAKQVCHGFVNWNGEKARVARILVKYTPSAPIGVVGAGNR